MDWAETLAFLVNTPLEEYSLCNNAMFEAQSHEDADGNCTDNGPHEPPSKGENLGDKAW
jgi:hypothetical protein